MPTDTPPGPDPALDAFLADIERRAGEAVLARAADIELFLLDVDGVMTDGGLIRGDDGLEYKRFHARDTIGLRLLRAGGVRVGIVSGRASRTLSDRAEEIGVDELVQGCDDKLDALRRIAASGGVPPERCAFMGDDVVDLAPMRRVRLALCPADAHPLVRAHAHHALPSGGGAAAVREACELVLQARGALRDALAPYLV